MDSLRYWVEVMHVDGFRFDLASVLGRDETGGFNASGAFFDAVAQDPVLTRTILIAEPWAEKAQAILTGWGADGRRAARRDLWLDLGLILGYAVGLSVAFSSAVSGVDAAASGCRASAARLFAWVPLLAGAADLAENGCLAPTLASYAQDDAKKLSGWPHAASVLSRTKFVLLGLSAGWALLVLWPLLVP
jgi:hypothetical protein